MTMTDNEQPNIWIPASFIEPVEPIILSDGSSLYSGNSYCNIMGYRPLQLDVRIPASVANPPLILWIHGGAWMMGDRRYLPETFSANQIFNEIISRGIAVATIDYRHSKEAPFPAQINDAKAALRYLRKFQSVFGFDGDRIAIMGESAGAHIATMVALTHNSPAFVTRDGVVEGSHEIAACVDWYGATDLTEKPRLKASPEEVEKWGDKLPNWYVNGPDYYAFMGHSDDLEFKKSLSPLFNVGPGIPPIYILHGDKDQVVNIEHSNKFAQALHESGADYQYEVVPGANHIWMGVSADEIKSILNKSIDFLERRLNS